MRWWIFLVLLLIPSVHADMGWYYAGDTFKIGNNLYSVEGTDTDRVLLSVNSNSYVIELGECQDEAFAKYCYVNTAYPSDAAHIKYAAGHQYFGYEISIEELKPSLEISRSISNTTQQFGVPVSITVTMTNKGDDAVQYLTYREPVPEGMRLLSGPSTEVGYVTYTVKNIAVDEASTFTYTLVADDYVNERLTPNITYTYRGGHFNSTATGISLVVDSPLSVGRKIPATVNLGENLKYDMNLSNRDTTDDLDVQVKIHVPVGLDTLDADGFTEMGNRTLVKSITIKPNTNQSAQLTFYSIAAASYKIPVEITATIHGTGFQRFYEEPVTVKADKLVAAIQVSGTRTTFNPGEELNIRALLANVNGGVTYQKVTGLLSAPGLFPDKSFSTDTFSPGKNITEAEVLINTPAVAENTTFNITLNGKYETPTGGIYDFHAQKSIIVNSAIQAVSLTRNVQPAIGAPGGNVTIALTAKNTLGKYMIFTAYDTSDLKNVGGLMYVDTSLERDQAKELYIYQLAIPENYNKTTIDVTTTVKLKDDPTPLVSTITIPVNTTPRTTINTSQNASAHVAPTVATVTEEKPGFWRSIWNSFLSLFD